MSARKGPAGQVLVLFTLFLLVLLGISALAVDYASWLLTDRALQNVADHAALAGASEFNDRTAQENCSGGVGGPKCVAARAQAWTSLSNELGLNLSVTTINCLAVADSPNAGELDSSRASSGACTSEAAVAFGHRIWVSTPPPNNGSYTNFGGRYGLNYGVVWTRVDRDVRSFLGGALGIQPDPRSGWATAGALPTDFALEVFCRNHIAPQSGVCENSAGLTIDGQGGIRLIRGDIGSNESLTVTANTGGGVVLESGNMFLVHRTCAPSTWNCPTGGTPQGGISDGVNGKNAFYMAPIAIPRFASPLDVATISAYDCAGASTSALCVPFKDQGSASPSSPGDWTCSTSSSAPVRCGAPTVSSGVVSCVGQGGGVAGNHYYPVGVNNGAPDFVGDSAHTQSNGNEYRNIDDVSGDPDTTSTPANPPTDYVTSENLNITGGGSPGTKTETLIVNLGQSGPRLSGISTVRYVAFKTNGTALSDDGYAVTLDVRLLPGSGTTAIAVDSQRTLTGTPTLYEFTIGAGVIPAAQFNSLRLQFTFTSTGVNNDAQERGGGVAWAEIQHPDPQPATPPMIPPGYYRSIDIPNDGCAILDPTAEYSSLAAYQMPGVYRFGGSGSSNTKKIKLGSNAYLIGDGVTMVFDPSWPDSGSNQGIAIGSSGALVLNTQRVPGVPACTPSETETANLNMSAPLADLPSSAVCAAWGIDHTVTFGIRPGQAAWPSCDPANVSNPHCVNRNEYNPVAGYRGITFYFTPDPDWSTAHGSMDIRRRFEMSGGSGSDSGIAFRGVLYAPYDDVKISGANGFNTVGQVLAWTAKFNGGSAYIDLDYPYDYTPAAPYLLEPTIDH